MLRVAFALLFGTVLGTAQPAPAAPRAMTEATTEAAAQLASHTSSLLPRHATVSLDLQNLSALPAVEWSNFRSLFEAELRKAGIEVAAGTPAEPRVRITLAENARGLLLVAEITSGDKRQIAMLPWNPPPSPEEQPRMALTKKFLWAQPEPILDVMLLDSDTEMLVLTVNKVASFRLSGGHWTPGASASLVLPRPIPRDPRGRIESAPDGFRAYLPGATCTGILQSDLNLQPDLKVTCAPGNETWPDARVRWITDRNLLESDAAKTPFYTTANGLFGGAEGWGSDIAPVNAGKDAGKDDACGGIIASSNTDHDSVRVYTTQALAESDALPLPGPVTALWPAETRGQVTLVVRNAQTGEYEASRLGLACSQ
jgi:hypothetical protein